MPDQATTGLEQPLLQAQSWSLTNWELRLVRGPLRCRSITALRPRRSSNSRGNRSPASEITVAPWNSTRSCGLNQRRTGPDVASPSGRCPPYQ
jgi:hypothetical protein